MELKNNIMVFYFANAKQRYQKVLLFTRDFAIIIIFYNKRREVTSVILHSKIDVQNG